MDHIGIGFQGTSQPLRGDYVTARGLHGVLYNVLKQSDPRGATWLHKHDAPKPYTMAPYYDTERGTLAGIRLSAMTRRSADLLARSWQTVHERGHRLHLGRLPFAVSDVAAIPGPRFEELMAAEPVDTVRLRFLSPTAFRQGPGSMPLPVPVNVFSWPFRVWQAFAPHRLQAPGDWLAWCERNVFVTAHAIETASVVISRKEPSFVGFVGEVTFHARADELVYLSAWHALAQLTAYAGVGHKTTMGMGATELI